MLAERISTIFGLGYTPYAPGTLGSVVGLLLALVLGWLFDPLSALFLLICLFALGVWASGHFARRSGMKDPRAVIIDEVVGQWLAVLFIPHHILSMLCAFLIFRALDILKPWPAYWFDRKIEGGWGIMLDDLVAACYTFLILAVLFLER